MSKKTKFSKLWSLKDCHIADYTRNNVLLRKYNTSLEYTIKFPKLIQELMRAEYERGKNEIKSDFRRLLK